MDKNNRVIYGIAGDGEIMRVVICDDEKVTCSEIEKMLSFFAFEKCIKLEVDVFFDGDTREFDSWISEKSTCRSHKTCFFCVKFLVFIYCILLQCVVKYNKGGILHASYYIEI